MTAPIRLNPPEGYRCYGANQGFALSAKTVDGLPVYFFSQEGWGYAADNDGFGHYVFEQVGDRRAEYAYYKGGDVMDGRGDLYIGGNGLLYVTGNESDQDKTDSVYIVPGFVPFAGQVGGLTNASLLARLATLETKLAQLSVSAAVDPRVADILKRLGSTEGTAAKANDRALNALNQLGSLVIPPAGISRDDAWVMAPQAVYADLTNPKSGIGGQIRAIAATVAVAGGIDQPARDLANAALTQASDIKNNLLPMYAGTNQVRVIAAQEAEKYTARLWAAWVGYTDKRLLDLIWDRGVKLARFLKVSGAATAPINDPANLKV